MALALRPYQERLIADAREAFREHRRVMLQAPTGAGKTLIFAWLSRSVAERGRRVCILAHRRELVRQASQKLDDMGVSHAVVAAGSRAVHRVPVTVASVQTLARRLDLYRDAFDLLVVDECHHATAGTWAAVTAAYPKARILGVTATPQRLDSRGLADAFDCLIVGPSVRDLIAQGFLAPYRAYAPADGPPDLSRVKRVAGDYDSHALAEIMSGGKLVGCAVEHYRRHADGLPAVAFCVTVQHAEAVAEQFRAEGYRAVSVDGSLPDDERDRRIRGLEDGSVQILTSCSLISEGLDIPGISAAILLRPTQSLGLHLQQVGRALRPKPDGSAAVILDHAGNCSRHGLPCQDRTWTLTQSRPAKKRDAPTPIRTCQECYAIAPAAAKHCPACGLVFVADDGIPEHAAGELVEMRPSWWAPDGRPAVERRRADIDLAVARCRTWGDLKDLAKALGFKPGWCAKIAQAKGWKPTKFRPGGFPVEFAPRAAAPVEAAA
jgi:superfamily II DNA or RNA helicase